MYRIVSTGLVLLALANYSEAQTFEETGAFILMGVTDKAILNDGRNSIVFRKTSDSPPTFEFRSPRRTDANVKIKFEDVGSCKIRLLQEVYIGTSSVDPIDISETIYDFSKTNGDFSYTIEPGTNMASTEIGGIGYTCRSLKGSPDATSCNGRTISLGSRERLSKAIAYMREKYCRGSAF